MGFLSGIVSGGLGIVSSLIGARTAKKEGARQRQYGAEQSAFDRAQQDKQIALKARELGIGEDQFRQMFGLREEEFEFGKERFGKEFEFGKERFGKEFGLEQERFGFGKERFGKEFGLRETESEARRKAYEDMIAKGGGQFAAGEAGFLEEAGKTPVELEQMKKDILSGRSEALTRATGEMGAALAKAGMRGGAAGTQLRRGIGQMGIEAQRDINRLIGGDAMRRAAERRAYQATKARTGQQAQLRPAAF